MGCVPWLAQGPLHVSNIGSWSGNDNERLGKTNAKRPQARVRTLPRANDCPQMGPFIYAQKADWTHQPQGSGSRRIRSADPDRQEQLPCAFCQEVQRRQGRLAPIPIQQCSRLAWLRSSELGALKQTLASSSASTSDLHQHQAHRLDATTTNMDSDTHLTLEQFYITIFAKLTYISLYVSILFAKAIMALSPSQPPSIRQLDSVAIACSCHPWKDSPILQPYCFHHTW